MSSIRRQSRSFRPPVAPRSVRGAGMVEVLVSVLVLAIGLLGVAAMQATALRNSQSALERSQGVVYTYSILDAMRANQAAARAGTYNIGMTCAPPGGGTIVTDDQNTWIQSLQRDLGPTACGSINCAADVCEIRVQWDDSRGTGGSTAQTFISRARI